MIGGDDHLLKTTITALQRLPHTAMRMEPVTGQEKKISREGFSKKLRMIGGDDHLLKTTITALQRLPHTAMRMEPVTGFC
ncbi:hypothetical protein DY000_02041327 [Brassica cretica]|uniref:RST domain-containing protein n=1 Tax=Brassica cretica TaxID=69181 RepID=A0ABQ7BF07_BRACR|nr:hypothetical protein DY000_02041327 [Brassica cretica]